MRAIDLFCGCGGLTLGFEQVGFDVVAGVDVDRDALATYRANFNHLAVARDLATTSPSEFFDGVELDAANIGLVIGAPPCKGFSRAGPRDAADERNQLVFDFADYVEFIEPELVVMENVADMLTLADGEIIDELRDRLAQTYTVRVEQVDAVNYGVPQFRERAFIVASRGGQVAFPDGESARVTVSNAIGDLPDLAAGECGERNSHNAVAHGQARIDRIAETEQGDSIDGSTQRVRLHADRPSRTITSRKEQYAHPTADRVLTVRERARLQTFPDWFEFRGPRAERRAQTANAVPPRLAKRIAETLDRYVVCG